MRGHFSFCHRLESLVGWNWFRTMWKLDAIRGAMKGTDCDLSWYVGILRYQHLRGLENIKRKIATVPYFLRLCFGGRKLCNERSKFWKISGVRNEFQCHLRKSNKILTNFSLSLSQRRTKFLYWIRLAIGLAVLFNLDTLNTTPLNEIK